MFSYTITPKYWDLHFNHCLSTWQEAVNVSLANLLTFPFIEERVHDGRLQIYGMHYDFVEGKLTSWRIVQSQVPVSV